MACWCTGIVILLYFCATKTLEMYKAEVVSLSDIPKNVGECIIIEPLFKPARKNIENGSNCACWTLYNLMTISKQT